MEKINYPLMENNIIKDDVKVLIDFLQHTDKFTQGSKVKEFESEFSRWLGVKYSLLVNSGASANLLTITALKLLYGGGEIIVPSLTWSSDISSVIFNGFTPVFVDIDLKNLCMDEKQLFDAITPDTRAVFLTHVLGFNGISQNLLNTLEEKNIILIEDVCESMGAVYDGKKLGCYGFASNFSFYYAHHMCTIEGGMICTNNEMFYETLRMLRSHGMLRECTSDKIKEGFTKSYPNVNEEFFFAYPGFNVRSTELNAVIGLNQLNRVDENNKKRTDNFKMFLEHLNNQKYYTEFDVEGSCNYALILILKNPDKLLFDKVTTALRDSSVEFRRGTAGGGSMLIQPFVKDFVKNINMSNFKNVEHIHYYGMYIGNYPDLEKDKILRLCKLLNSL